VFPAWHFCQWISEKELIKEWKSL